MVGGWASGRRWRRDVAWVYLDDDADEDAVKISRGTVRESALLEERTCKKTVNVRKRMEIVFPESDERSLEPPWLSVAKHHDP